MNIIVTGASRGLGLEITRRLLMGGHHVFALSRTQSAELNQLLEQYADQLQLLTCDLGEPESIKENLSSAIPNETPVHGLVNNAALAYDDLASNLNLERLEAMFRSNVFSVMELSKWAIRRMLLHKTAGSLVHISSISVHTGYKGLAMYAASKGAVEAYSKNIAREWGGQGIRSNCVVAGFMETSMSASLSDEQRQKIYRRTALQQATSPASVAASVEFLLSEVSQSITGQNLFVDSGTV
ncbi:MAG: SDR family oxidoreductase [bacterium]|nr:SDR family oxidoreductase [bacterium]